MQGADQIGREHEGALQHRDDQQIFGFGGGDLQSERLVAGRDRLSSNSTLTCRAPLIVPPSLRQLVRPRGELDQDVADALRRRRQPRAEGHLFVGPEPLLGAGAVQT